MFADCVQVFPVIVEVCLSGALTAGWEYSVVCFVGRSVPPSMFFIMCWAVVGEEGFWDEEREVWRLSGSSSRLIALSSPPQVSLFVIL